jgi:alpha-tubulin suppressor-like RCC1 family protein
LSELGVGSDLNPPVEPNPVATSLRFKELAAGLSHTCGLTADGTPYCWGAFELGALGADTVTTYCYLTIGPQRCAYAPIPVATTLKFTSIAAGYTRTCALTADGATYCWGTNHGPLIGYNFGLGDGTTDDSKVPRRVASGLTFTSIVIGARHTCALTPAGAAYCWGYNYSGQLGDGTRDLYALSPVPVVGGHKFTALAAGWTSTCGITTTGAVYCWGDVVGSNEVNPVPTLMGGITAHKP